MKTKSSIVFTGDIGFDRYMYGKWNDENLLSREPFPESFIQKLMHKDMTVESLGDTPMPTTYEELAKLAIRYSDGITINGDNIPASLIEYAQSLGKPILTKQSDEEFNAACNSFYDTIQQ